MGCYDEAVLRQHLLLSMVPYGIILRRRLLPPPAHASSCVTCYCRLPSIARHPPSVICCLLLSQNSPPNLVDCRRRHRPLLLHRSPCQRYDIAPAIVAVTPQCRSRETLMSTSTLASTAFASRRQPLAEWRCRVRSHVAPDACRCRYWCRCHHLRVVVVIVATPTIAEPMLPDELSRHHLPVR
jgi:hypothetical protein